MTLYSSVFQVIKSVLVFRIFSILVFWSGIQLWNTKETPELDSQKFWSQEFWR